MTNDCNSRFILGTLTLLWSHYCLQIQLVACSETCKERRCNKTSNPQVLLGCLRIFFHTFCMPPTRPRIIYREKGSPTLHLKHHVCARRAPQKKRLKDKMEMDAHAYRAAPIPP